MDSSYDISDNPAYGIGMQAGINALATELRGKVDAMTLYMAHQLLSSQIGLRVPQNPQTYIDRGESL